MSKVRLNRNRKSSSELQSSMNKLRSNYNSSETKQKSKTIRGLKSKVKLWAGKVQTHYKMNTLRQKFSKKTNLWGHLYQLSHLSLNWDRIFWMIKGMKEMKHSQIGLNFQGQEEILWCLKQDREGQVLEEAQPEVHRGQSHRIAVKLSKIKRWTLIN